MDIIPCDIFYEITAYLSLDNLVRLSITCTVFGTWIKNANQPHLVTYLLDNNAKYKFVLNDPYKWYVCKSNIWTPMYGDQLISMLGNRLGHIDIIDLHNKIELDTNFHNDLDRYQHIIAFTNGVYNLYTDMFIDNRPEYVISLCTGYPYQNSTDNETEFELRDFLTTVMPDSEMRHYLLKKIYMSLANTEDEIFVLLATDNFSRHMINQLIILIEYALGDLFKMGSADLLKNKYADKSDPDSDLDSDYYQIEKELGNKKGVRFCAIFDPIEMDCACVKLRSGNDSVLAMDSDGHVFTYRPQFTTFIVCDKCPKINDPDKGLMRRLRIVPITSENCGNAYGYECANVCDNTCGNATCNTFNPEKWRSAFMNLLIAYRRIEFFNSVYQQITDTTYRILNGK